MIEKLIVDNSLNMFDHIERESIHLVVTSPPYNIGIDYDKYDDNKELKEYLELMKNVFSRCYEALVDGGRICINIDSATIKGKYTPLFSYFYQIMEDIGFTTRATIVWKKGTENKQSSWGSFMSPSNPNVVPTSEFILVFHKGSPRLNGDTRPDISKAQFISYSNGTWQFAPETQFGIPRVPKTSKYHSEEWVNLVKEIKENKKHPVPFPPELPKRCLLYYTYPEQTIMDPFAGLCTVAVAAKQYKRGYVCFDLSKKYIEIGKNRVKFVAKSRKTGSKNLF